MVVARAYRRLIALVEDRRINMGVRRDAAEVLRLIESDPGSKRGLFVDCGSNLGQGLTYFSKFFPATHFDYVLIEPNPNCIETLESVIVPQYPQEQIRVVSAAAATDNGHALLYGLTEDSRGALSDGASIVKCHNSTMYEADDSSACTIETFSFSEFLFRESKERPAVVVKMDIETAEYDVLPDMLSTGAASLVTLLFVEFHSRYMTEPDRTRHRQMEQDLMKEFDSTPARLRLWK
jgi:FkbM family methyltransferase